MKSKMSYKAKRNIIIIAIIVALVALASVGTYLFVSGNDETQALSKMNVTGDNKSGEEVEQSQNNDNQTQNGNEVNNDEELNNNENSTTNTSNEESNANNSTNSNTVNNNNNNNDNSNNNTQTINTTEEVERTETVVGFTTSGLSTQIGTFNAKLANIEANMEAVTGNENGYVVNEQEITYNINVKSDKALEGINISTSIPEGTELVENTISDEGIVDNGMIAWKVDVDGEKLVSFTVKVIKTEGEITNSAVVNGKTTNTVTNTIDEIPVVTVVDPNRYQIEVGTEYVEKGYSAIDKEDGDITDKVVLTYRFQAIDSSNWTDPETIDTKLLGTYKITYTVTDSMGNVAKGTRVVQIVDTIAPELEVEKLNEAGYVNTENTQINVKDMSPFTTEVLDKDGNVLNTRESQVNDEGTYYDRFGIGWLGQGTFTVRVTDVAGNVTEKTFTVDSIAPELEVEKLNEAGYVNTENTQINVKDENSFVTEVFDKDGNLLKTRESQVNDEGTYYDRFGIGWLGQGTFTVKVTDIAGNVTEKTFTVDSIAPKLDVENLNEAGYVNTKGDRHINVDDTNVFTVLILDKEGKELNRREGYQIENGTYHDRFNIAWLGEGTFTVKVTDIAGNVTEKTFTVDSTEPELEVEKLNEAGYVNTENTQINVKDANPFTTEIFDKDGKLLKTRESQVNGEGTYYDRFGIGWLGEGTFTVKVTDKAGNVTEKTFTVDSIAPELEVEKLNEAGYVNTEDPQINIKDANPFTTEVLDKDGKVVATAESEEPNEEYNRDTYYDRFGIGWLGEGTFTVKVTDIAGNVTEKTFTVDRTIPELEVEKLNEAGYVNTENTQINVKDANPFTTEVFDKDGKLLKTREAQVNDEGTYYDRFGIGWLGEGTFTVRVTDKAGNVTEKTFTVDSIAPEISIKDGNYINTNISPRITESNLESATISKDSGEAQEYPITEGVGREISKEGKYTITLTDKAGNETIVSFIIDKTAPSMKVGEIVYGPDTTEIIYSAERFRAEAIDELSGMEQIYTNGQKRDRIDVNGEGKYTFRLVDKAGNESTFTVIVDKTAPVSKSADFYVTGKTSIVKEEAGKNYQFYYAKNGDKLILNAKFKEELAQVPTFTLIDSNNTEYILTGEYAGIDDKGGYTYKTTYNIAEDESNLAEGELTFKISNISDKAGNVGEDITKTSNGRRIIYDRTVPVLTVKDGKDKNEEEYTIGNEPYFSRISFALSDNIAVKEYIINGKVCSVTPNKWSDANYIGNLEKILVNGENTIILRDMAGNETNEYKFYYDNTPARRTATNILVYGDKNENKEFYAKIGDTIQAYIAFKEELAQNPTFILINDGKEYKVDASLVTKNGPNEDGRYTYQVLYKIEDNTEFVNGEITLKVTDLVDMYGNKISDETEPTNGHKVYFDKTAPVLGEGHPLYILNRDNKNNRKYIGDNEYLRVEANFDEELAEEPVLTIGTGENTQIASLKSNKYSETSGNYVYVWDVKLDNSILKLEDGTVVPFTITNVKDKAGNEATFNNDDVTPYKDIYDQVIYDNTAPTYKTLGILNLTHLRDNQDNNTNKAIDYITTGDKIRVLVSFEEELAVEPKVRLNGDEDLVYDCTFRKDSSSDTVFYYMADITITEEMNLPEEEIQIEVYGYKDAAENEGAKLNNTNINSTSYTNVIFDKTAPSMKVDDKLYGPDTTEIIYSAKRFKAEAIDELSGMEQIYTNGHERDKIDVSAEGKYTFRLVDKAGNESTFTVIIDKTAPIPTFSYSNYSEGKYLPTNQNVVVTLNSNEAIKDIEGWEKVDDKTFTKEYSKNGEYEVIVEDLVGNISKVKCIIKGIDKEEPQLKLNGDSYITIEAGEEYNDKGAIAVDNVDGTVEAEIDFIHYYQDAAGKNLVGEVDSIDTTKPGLYKIVFKYTDNAGNVGLDSKGQDFLIRNVIVEEA